MPYSMLACDACDSLIQTPSDAIDGHGPEDDTCFGGTFSRIELFTEHEIERRLATLAYVIVTAHRDGGYFLLARTPRGEMSTHVESTVEEAVAEGMAAVAANGSLRALVVTPSKEPRVENCPTKEDRP